MQTCNYLKFSPHARNHSSVKVTHNTDSNKPVPLVVVGVQHSEPVVIIGHMHANILFTAVRR